MKVRIKLVASFLYLVLATKAAPMGNEKVTYGGKEDAGFGKIGGKDEADESEKQSEDAEEWKRVGERGEVGEMDEEERLAEEGENNATVKLLIAIVGSQPLTAYSVRLDDCICLDKNGDGFIDNKESLEIQNFINTYRNAAILKSDKNVKCVITPCPYSTGQKVEQIPGDKTSGSQPNGVTASFRGHSGTDASENFTSPPYVTPTPEQTNNASPEGTAHQLPEDNVITTVPTAEQSSTGQMVMDEESSVSVDTSNKTIVSSNGNSHGKESFATSQGQNEGANGKAGSTVGSKEGGASGSNIGHPPANGYQTAASKGGAAAGSTGGQVKIATGQKVGQIPGDKTSGSQPSGVPASFGGHRVQGGKYSQTNGQAGHAGSGVSHAAAVAGKPVGQSMSHTRTNGVQPEAKVHTAGKPHQDVHSKPAQPSWSSKPQEPAKQKYHWDGPKWVKADVQQGVSVYEKSKDSEYNGIGKSAGMVSLPDQKKESTEDHSNEEEDNESKNKEDKKSENENGKGDSNESDDK